MKNFALIIIVSIIALLSSCKKEEKASTTNNTTPTPTAQIYFTGTIDGQSVVYNNGENDFYFGAGFSNSNMGSSTSTEMGQTISVDQYPPDEIVLTVYFQKVIPYLYTCDDIIGIFHTGSYNYGKSYNNNNNVSVDGVIISVKIGTDYWRSDLGSANQTGSTFNVTELIDNNITGTIGIKVIKAAFSCKVYDGNGNSKTITGAEIRSTVGSCN